MIKQNDITYNNETDIKLLKHILQKVDRTLLNKSTLNIKSTNQTLAMTDRKDIHINFNEVANKSNDNNEFILLSKALNMHEMGHVLFSNHTPEMIKKITDDNSFFRTINALEDCRIELGVSEKFPITKKYFQFTFNKFILETLVPDVNSGKIDLENLQLVFARVYGTKFIYHNYEYSDTIQNFETIFNLIIDDLDKTNKIKQLTDDYIKESDTMNRLKVAYEFHKLIIQDRNNNNQNQLNDYKLDGNFSADSKQKSNDELSEQIEKILDEIKKKGNYENKEQRFDREIGDMKDDVRRDGLNDKQVKEIEETMKNKEDNNTSNQSQKDNTKNTNKNNCINFSDELKNQINDVTKNLNRDIKDKNYEIKNFQLDDDVLDLRILIEETKNQYSQKVNFIGKKTVNGETVFTTSPKVQSIVNNMKREINKIKNGLGFSITRNNVTGKFNLNSFVNKRKSNHWNKVFDKKRINTKNRSQLAVSVIIDSSGSVSPYQYNLELNSAFTIAKSLELTNNKCEVIEFSGKRSDVTFHPERTYEIIKGFNDKCFKGDWKRHFDDVTIVIPSLICASNNLMKLNKQTKYSNHIIVITDGALTGCGTGSYELEQQIKKIQKQGIKVYQVCVGEHSHANSFFDKTIKVEHFHELNDKMRELILEIQDNVKKKVQGRFR